MRMAVDRGVERVVPNALVRRTTPPSALGTTRSTHKAGRSRTPTQPAPESTPGTSDARPSSAGFRGMHRGRSEDREKDIAEKSVGGSAPDPLHGNHRQGQQTAPSARRQLSRRNRMMDPIPGKPVVEHERMRPDRKPQVMHERRELRHPIVSHPASQAPRSPTSPPRLCVVPNPGRRAASQVDASAGIVPAALPPGARQTIR